ncbi:hypothetical protein PHYBOEH_005553 [Phytophthora boehmeriae]|uniref:Bzip transcription factor n=1 Tax=Phytophthora boehmeriae TaxID=109152 RepID=A0A8T1WR53_9STRA|nr:hypothetical protein PHYBOEH_005553 [Phytophthora boehmeriae]
MSESVLCPPNNQRLSSCVIGEVRQRSRSTRPDLFQDVGDLIDVDSFIQELMKHQPAADSPISRPINTESTAGATSYDPRDSRRIKTDYTRSPPRSRRAEASTKQTKSFDVKLLRERRRINMARYRKKQDDKIINCVGDIQRLRLEIQQLTHQRDLLVAGIPTKTTAWNVATEFFRLFRFGYKETEMTTDDSTRSQRGSNVQENFLRATMAEDVTGFGVCGIERMIERVRHISLIVQGVDVTLTRLESDADDSVVANFGAKVTITEASVRRFFAHVVNDTDEDKWRHLCSRLLGRQLLLNGSLRLDWDDTNECVTRLFFQCDMIAPLMGLLSDVSDLFDNNLKLTSKCTLVRQSNV